MDTIACVHITSMTANYTCVQTATADAYGLSSEQKLTMNMRHYNLSWWIYRPQEAWEKVYANDAYPQENVKQPLTHESGWIKGTPRTNVFQENTRWISADSIEQENSSPSIERIRPGFANERLVVGEKSPSYSLTNAGFRDNPWLSFLFSCG